MRAYSLILLVILFSVSKAQKVEKDWTKLTLSTGAIRGRKVVTEKSTTGYLFHGIPYAEPPIGDLRYRAPIDKKSWEGELDATSYKYTCMSSQVFDKKHNESEDCLHINVFTNEKCMTEKNCGVMYYIFGGAWNFGNPFVFGTDEYLVDNFQSRDVILVTVSYRMGSFGFFNTGKRTSAVKNLALLDLIQGLRWTQHEIGAFGGDKNKVTVMGHSSGAAGADLISLSPKSVGLLNQIVPMSGSATSNLRQNNNVKESRSIAVMAGCASESQWDEGETFEDIIKCLREKSATELISIQRKLESNGESFHGPTIDEEDGVLPGNIEELLRNRRPYRLMIGTTSREYRTAKIIVEKGEINQPLLFATCVLLVENQGFKRVRAVAEACVDDYSKRPSDIADLADDLSIYLATYKSREAMRSKGATVYTYSFEYDQIGEAFLGGIRGPNIESPFHAEDLVYVIGLGGNKFTEKDQKIRRIYSGMFAEFIRTGDPSPPNNKWQPTDDRNNFFKINFDDNMNMPGNTDGFHAGAVKFWTKTAPKIDKSFSNFDKDDTFSFTQLMDDLIHRVKDSEKSVNNEIKEKIAKWNNVAERNLNNVGDLTNMYNDLLKLLENDDDDDKKQKKQQIRLPSVRQEIIGTKDTNWKLWFWVAAGVAVVLAVILLATCCCNNYQRKKRNEYERLNETSRLNPSSATTYGAKYL